MNAPSTNNRRLNLDQVVPQQGLVVEDDDDVIDIRGVAHTLWRGKWIVVICTLIAAVLGFLAVSQLEPTYRASAKVMFDIQQSNVVNIEDVLIDQQFDASELEDQIEVLRSTTLIERVIAELNLDQNPEFNPRLRPAKVTLQDRISEFVSLPPEIEEFAQNIGIIPPPPVTPDPVEAARRERLMIINNVREGLSLRPIGRSRVIEISFVSGNPRTSAQVVNTVADQYIVDQLEAKLEATRAATTWLSDRVEQLRERVQDAEQDIEAARSQSSDNTGQSKAVTEQQLQALNGALSSTRAEISRKQSTYDRLVDAVNTNRDIGAISEFRQSSLIERYRQQEDDLLLRKITLETTFSDNNPDLIRVNQQIAQVRQNITDEVGRIVTAAQLDLQSARNQENALLQQVRRLEQQLQVQSKDQIQLRQLEREAQASRVLYENFLARLKETSTQEDLQEADARVLSPAEQPLYPESQAKRRTMMLATIVGGILGIGLVFLLDRLNNTFRTPAQLEELSGETVLGVLPAIGSKVERRKVINHLREKPGSGLAEAVRNLRTSILFSNIDRTPKVVMFTSSVPREGKSTSSMLVALTSRQMGKSAIIVDCDLRLPALARLLDAKDGKPGLMSVLEGQAEINEAVYIDPETGLHVLMPRGATASASINAADVLSSRKFSDLIDKLQDMYDLVILDTPPALVVTDARIVSKLADTVVYAVHWDKTPRDAVFEGLQELRSVQAPLAGVVMTMVNEDRASRYSYSGYSYYKGKYRDYYGT